MRIERCPRLQVCKELLYLLIHMPRIGDLDSATVVVRTGDDADDMPMRDMMSDEGKTPQLVEVLIDAAQHVGIWTQFDAKSPPIFDASLECVTGQRDITMAQHLSNNLGVLAVGGAGVKPLI
jgi:hypothetical protein